MAKSKRPDELKEKQNLAGYRLYSLYHNAENEKGGVWIPQTNGGLKVNKFYIYLILALCLLLTACGTGEEESSELSLSEPESELVPYQEEELESSSEIVESEPESTALESETEVIYAEPESSTGTASSSSSQSTSSSMASSESQSAPGAPESSLAANPPATSTETSSGSGLESVELQIIDLINAERKSQGLSALTYDANLSKASLIRSKELYQNSYFAHTRPNGDSWQTVLKVDVPISYTLAGENLAEVEHNMPDYDPALDAAHWFTTWKNSPSHYENIVRSGFTHVGVAIYYQEKNGMVHAYATTIFAAY